MLCERLLLELFGWRSASAGGDSEFDSPLARSKAAPAVLGVFAEDPKAAKAPEPSPKADDAPGDAVLAVFIGGKPLPLPAVASPEAYRFAPKRD